MGELHFTGATLCWRLGPLTPPNHFHIYAGAHMDKLALSCSDYAGAVLAIGSLLRIHMAQPAPMRAKAGYGALCCARDQRAGAHVRVPRSAGCRR